MSISFKKIFTSVSILTVALMLAGTEACQKSYDFANQANISQSASPTASSSVSGSPTASPSATASSSTSASESDTDSDTSSATPSASTAALNVTDRLDAFSSSLASYVRERKLQEHKAINSENWLGKAYKDSEVVPGMGVDSDGDGFTDALEVDAGTDARNANNFPTNLRTKLSNRLDNRDDDGDGLPNEEELKRGSDPFSSDSDKDGFADGAEVLSKTNLLDNTSKPRDRDGDGLSDDFESDYGTNPNSADTDFDGLRDDSEFALASDPYQSDSDHDGVLDGKEVILGSDPTIPEWQ